MNETSVRCPQCKQPTQAIIEQLFDVTTDPEAKRRLLGRVSNYVRCATCGHQGPLSTPIVYHDNEKELLLTYFPPELGLSANDQERIIGPLIKQAMERLPQEKRKAYFLSPKNFFTFQSMMENILEKDGVTKDMLDEQQKQLALLQRLLETPISENRVAMIKEQAAIVNEKFFMLFERVAQSAIASGEKEAMDSLTQIQQELINNTEHGKKVSAEIGEMEEAVRSLQTLGNNLTRESLIQLLIDAPNEARVTALVNMTRGGMDQPFFDAFNIAIDAAPPEDQARLKGIRDKVLEVTKELDIIMRRQVEEADKFIKKLLESSDLEQATLANIQAFENETVMAVLEAKVREAQTSGIQTELEKYSKIFAIIQQASTPPEIELINGLVEIADQDDALEKALKENADLITDEVEQFTLSMIQQIEKSDQVDERAKEILDRLNIVYRKILSNKMRRNLS